LFPIKPAGLYGKSRIPDLQDLKRLTISRAGAHFTLPDIMRLRFLGSAAMRRLKGCWRKTDGGIDEADPESSDGTLSVLLDVSLG